MGTARPQRDDSTTDVERKRARDDLRAARLPPRPQTQPPTFAVRQRLMLVEDDFMLRAHMSELLASEGYLVSCAADGAEALDRLEREPPPAAILLDMVMPRMNGVSFREAQLQSPALRDIPTIAVTALHAAADVRGLGFEDIIAKPVQFDRLVEALAKLCPST
jgi:two-component system chemotaxis response regulator CheY